MRQNLKILLRETLKDMGVKGVESDVEISDKPVYGEYTTNVAMRLASQLKKAPMDIGLEVVDKIKIKSAKFKVKAQEHITDRSGQTESGDKTIYTILNMNSSGVRGKLFRVEKKPGTHFVSLWNHKEIKTIDEGSNSYMSVDAPGWDPSFSGTRKEGSVDCIAQLPDLLNVKLNYDSITLSRPGKGQVILWKGDPSFTTQKFQLNFNSDTTIRVSNIIGYYEGKVVIQYLENNRLKDESIVDLKGGKPWLVSRVTKTKPATSLPSDMVLVPKSKITFSVTTDEDFIVYPGINVPVTAEVDSFLIDKYPVTNDHFYQFLGNSGYRPADTTNFLRHWQNGIYRQGQDKYPVVYVSYEDINAYLKWAGKRLPTQAEWQLAAQGTDGRKWPWGDEFHGTWCNNAFGRLTPVDAFPKGSSPYNVMDLVGNIWQVTNDMYFNGTNYFVIIRGGSYYKPESSWWYIRGGPQQLDRTQILLMMSQGFDRSATVGFRGVKDIENVNYRDKK